MLLNAALLIQFSLQFQGELVVFQVALGLLECCRKELLTLDFEGVLKYFRVQLPKKYRNEDQVKILIKTAVKMKVRVFR